MPTVDRTRWKTGVYLITNIINGKVYVGSSSRQGITRRLRQHVRELKAKKHKNARLQNAWNKYGEDAFQFSTLLLCPPEHCIRNEQSFINQFKSFERGYGYNISPTAGSTLGTIPSIETKAKLSAVLSGRKKSTEHAQKVAIALKGRTQSAEHKARISAALKGRKLSDNHKANISVSLEGNRNAADK